MECKFNWVETVAKMKTKRRPADTGQTLVFNMQPHQIPHGIVIGNCLVWIFGIQQYRQAEQFHGRLSLWVVEIQLFRWIHEPRCPDLVHRSPSKWDWVRSWSLGRQCWSPRHHWQWGVCPSVGRLERHSPFRSIHSSQCSWHWLLCSEDWIQSRNSWANEL